MHSIDNALHKLYNDNINRLESRWIYGKCINRMDDNLKKQAEDLFNDLGMNLTTAFTIFVKQAIREQGIPFEITREIPNSETISAINEVQQMKQNPSLGKAYTDVDKMMEELLA